MDLDSLLDYVVQNEESVLDWMAYVMIITAAVVALLLQFVDAPYGRYASSSWGCLVNGKVAWVLQELPSLLVPVSLLYYHAWPIPTPNAILISMFLIHYTQR